MLRPTSTSQAPSARPWRAALAAAALAACGLAHADNVGITTHDVLAAPGGAASVTFDFDFGASATLSSFEVHLNYDKSLLGLTGSSVSYQGVSVDPAVVLGAAFSTNFADPQGASALWISATDADNLKLSGKGAWTLSYALLPGLTAPSSTPVTLDFSFSDANLDPGLVNGAATPSLVTSTIHVSAVPEPQTWALCLAGFSVVALRARRRTETPTV